MNRNLLRLVFTVWVAVLALNLVSWAGDTSVLRPPKGSKVALIVFEDLQCPDCARAAPLLHEAAKKYNIPLVQYDFPLPMHNWSFEAAVNARYFDTLDAKAAATTKAATTTRSSGKGKSKGNATTTGKASNSRKLGDEYRLFIFQNQPEITKDNLRGMTERFADDHKVPLPFVVDPNGDLAAKVRADFQVGQRVGIVHTPTIYVVGDTTRGRPFVEVVDRSQLYQLIDQVENEAAEASPSNTASAKSSSVKKGTKSQ